MSGSRGGDATNARRTEEHVHGSAGMRPGRRTKNPRIPARSIPLRGRIPTGGWGPCSALRGRNAARRRRYAPMPALPLEEAAA
jgi:hypothetical protein